MSRWTSDRSALLSLLLNDVTGSKEVVAIRQDTCRLYDCITSKVMKFSKQHYTGSKAEGLNLPGSDEDFMVDINDSFYIKVVQSLHESSSPSPFSVFYLCTENTPTGFALLRCITPGISEKLLNCAIQSHYLSSNLMVENIMFPFTKCFDILHGTGFITKTARQGPSIERWNILQKPSESGTDTVPSIHCAFWPNGAKEWIERSRPFGWPTSHDVSSIVNFGCHLVPIGHPHSQTRSLEWRISFSVAERALVWSFNHVQMQCYAIMKIILKEFIKENCNPHNQVLCSYFIKTFLFWKYETKSLRFWQETNLRECIKYLLIEFRQCLNDGVIRHFFFPRFNLLSVKLTREAQTELLQLFDIVIQSDVSILRECRTLKNVWSKFVSADRNQIYIIDNERKRNFLRNDEIMMYSLKRLRQTTHAHSDQPSSRLFHLFPSFCSYFPKTDVLFFGQIIDLIWTLPCKTSLKCLVIKASIYEKHVRAMNLCQGNKVVYGVTAHEKSVAFDLSTCALWQAIVLILKREYTSALIIVNRLSCRIPPFARSQAYNKVTKDHEHNDTEQLPCSRCLYAEKFLNSEYSIMKIAREAWLTDLSVGNTQREVMPLAIQIELYFRNSYFNHVYLSPFTCLYYLMFLCYHELHQYDSRDRALRQLVDVTNTHEQCGQFCWHSYNIAGHCLLVAGEIDRARDMFLQSFTITLLNPPSDKFNSAFWYLQNFCS